MERQVSLVAIVTLCFTLINADKTGLKFYQKKMYHEPQNLTDNNIRDLAKLTDMADFKRVLDEILIPRLVGTPSHDRVRDFIINEMEDLGWNVTVDAFAEETPIFGTLNFSNIVASLNPNADRYLVLSCHYESKYMNYTFLGAIDSAVPCAMMINLAKVMSKQLEPLKEANLSLMFMFFDGEEAFKEWSSNDSTYGSSHLAQTMFNTKYKDDANDLQRIDMLVLLDLLGSSNPKFVSYFTTTEKWYLRLAAAEETLSGLGLLEADVQGHVEHSYFIMLRSDIIMEDDDLPFLRKNVDILHIIPTPFPDVWHTPQDDKSALNFNTIENLNKIFRVFVAEYTHIKV